MEWERTRVLVRAFGGKMDMELPIMDRLRRVNFTSWDLETEEHKRLRDLAERLIQKGK